MDKNKIEFLLNEGFNIMPIKPDKLPLGKWSQWQDTKITSLEQFNHKSDHYALICGFNDVEVIDIDLKVIHDLQLRREFWNNLFDDFENHIENFKEKCLIKQTRSGGYHVIYRAYNIEGNKKLAKLKGHTEAIIETRGVGGYVCMYDSYINSMDYQHIQFITEEERDTIIGICRVYNEEEPQIKEIIPTKVQKQYSENAISPWADFNNKEDIFDIISTDFSIVGKKPDKYLIKRTGAKSPHSGYIYKDSGCMYLFSTGTIYPAEELVSPFAAYTIKEHSGDFSKAASVLYHKGYGSRSKPVLSRDYVINKVKLPDKSFPIDIFPVGVQQYLLSCKNTLNASIDYMGCALLWAGSLMIGNSLRLKVKNGWSEIPTIWMACVGEAGWGKTPSINLAIAPLRRINGKEIKDHARKVIKYKEYEELTAKEKTVATEVQKPVNKQFIADDVTIEKLISIHSQNPAGVGVFKDELAGWFKDMNKYKEGSDKEQWLSCWSGNGISVDRITRDSDYIEKPIMPVLGGIQQGILTKFFTNENKDSGFLDRMLFCVPDIEIGDWNDKEMDSEILEYFENWTLSTYDDLKKLLNFNEYGDLNPTVINFSEEGRIEWKKIYNEISELQRSDKEPEFIKSVLAKHKTYIPRFALIINTLCRLQTDNGIFEVSKESVLKAKKLSEYFISMNKKLIQQNFESCDMEDVLNNTKGDISAKLKALVSVMPDFNKTKAAKILNISRNTLKKYLPDQGGQI